MVITLQVKDPQSAVSDEHTELVHRVSALNTDLLHLQQKLHTRLTSTSLQASATTKSKVRRFCVIRLNSYKPCSDREKQKSRGCLIISDDLWNFLECGMVLKHLRFTGDSDL